MILFLLYSIHSLGVKNEVQARWAPGGPGKVRLRHCASIYVIFLFGPTEWIHEQLSHLKSTTHPADGKIQTQNSPLGLTTSYLASYISIHNITFTAIHTESG